MLAYDRASTGIILLSTDAGSCRCSLRGYQVNTHSGGLAGDRLEIGGPFAEIFFSVIKYLASLVTMLKCRTRVARNNWGIVQQIQETATMAGKQDLLLSTLDCRGKMYIISFLELLPGLIVRG